MPPGSDDKLNWATPLECCLSVGQSICLHVGRCSLTKHVGAHPTWRAAFPSSGHVSGGKTLLKPHWAGHEARQRIRLRRHKRSCVGMAWRVYRRSGFSTDYARFSPRRVVFHRVVRRARRGIRSDWQEQVEKLRRRDPRVCKIRRCVPASRARSFSTRIDGLERDLNSIEPAESSR